MASEKISDSRERLSQPAKLRSSLRTLRNCFAILLCFVLYVYVSAVVRESTSSHHKQGNSRLKWTSCESKEIAHVEVQSPWQWSGLLSHVADETESLLLKKKKKKKKHHRGLPEFLCTRVDVPLTYEEGDHRTISLPLIKRPANPKTKSGLKPLFVNPGGPGGSGVGFVYGNGGKEVYNLFNGSRDVISFDPRGVNGSLPSMSCYSSTATRRRALSESGGLLRSAPDSMARVLGTNQVRGSGCSVHSKDIGEYISTYYVAKDMHYLAVQEYGTVGKVELDYWGFSYGTLLGMTYAKIFPDEIGNFVLDGVCDFDDYYSGAWTTNLVNTDEVFDYFYSSCAANPQNCPLAKNQGTELSAEEIKSRIEELLQSTKASPLVGWNGKDGGLITYSFLKSNFFRALYAPAKWPKMAAMFDGLINGKVDEFYTTYDGLNNILDNEAGIATLCGDSSATPKEPSIESIRNTTEFMETQSQFTAEYWAGIPLRCQYYPFTPRTVNLKDPAKEETRDWRNKVGSDILFVGNDYDIVTPLKNARAMAKRFGGSLLRIKDNYGHCSSALKSTCAEEEIHSWLTGSRNITRTTCTVDQGAGAFEGLTTWADAISLDEYRF